MKEVEFTDWKKKTERGKYEDCNTKYIYVTQYRDVDVDEDTKIEEGIILSHKEKYDGEQEYVDASGFMIGYHYVCLKNKKAEGDICSIFGIRDSRYVLSDSTDADDCGLYGDFEQAFDAFCELLKAKYNIKLSKKGGEDAI